jgi:pyruvate kinase
VLDGTDAVMLSAETAAGKYPVETVAAMSRICDEADRSGSFAIDKEFLNRTFTRIDQAIAMAALFTAAHMRVKAIASLTQSGSTALWISRLDSGVPIYALTPEESSRRRMSLYREVHPVLMTFKAVDRENLLLEAEQKLVDLGIVTHGDLVLMTIGEPIGKTGGTNTLKIVRVGEHL